MKLAALERGGRTELGIEVGPGEVAVPSKGPQSMLETIRGGPPSVAHLLAQVEAGDAELVDAGAARVLAPLARPPKIVAVGLNYHDHAREGGLEAPDRPLLFAKLPTSVIGPGEDITWDPGITDAVDYEAELAVVMGRRARCVDEDSALDFVFGYTCVNDVSARDLQFSDGQWMRSKSLDTFCPMGPFITTADSVPDPQKLQVTCVLNGEKVQDAETSDMVFGVAHLVAYLSRSFVLEPGDVIATGTPPGVGWFRDPKLLLGDGDEVTVAIAGIGELKNRCRTVS